MHCFVIYCIESLYFLILLGFSMIMVGDVLLVNGNSKLSSGLIAAQKTIYLQSRSSHVGLFIGEGILIHATGDNGIHLSFLPDEIKKVCEGWQVIRLKYLTDEQRGNIQKSALYYVRQSYNKKIMMHNSSETAFCSELVAKIYNRAEIPLFSGKSSSKIAPAHFDEAIDRGEQWEDVTHEYHELLADIEKNEFMYRQCFDSINKGLMKRAFTSRARSTLFDILKKIAEDSDDTDFKKVIEKIQLELTEQRILSFWDEKDGLPLDDK
ncbi:TPA: hypothetical protein JD250_05905 [Proteus mirabilis]|nr:hypothetical protein [Proteus mirabilis]HAU5533677.1 hypothetical protein [Proteus mirabilis]HAU5537215.1 hypothetical protein [Proteus mirabilis]HAU5541133.1 hypothetical protein [Proteus mirabilis]HAU5571691.1 hypothetical protein [Proteus mirabilis]